MVVCLSVSPTCVFRAGFSEKDSAEMKGIEAVTNHDLKAVEYFLKSKVCVRARLPVRVVRASTIYASSILHLHVSPRLFFTLIMCYIRLFFTSTSSQ